MTDIITIDEAVDIMASQHYDDDQKAKLRSFHENGRRVLIFQNEDLGHRAIGHVIAMPLDADKEIPLHGPDHPSIGLGWRYLTRYVVEPPSSSIQDLGEV